MLVIFRHGRTRWNLEKRLQGQEHNSDLLPVSPELKERVCREFGQVVFRRLFISPARRARDYADILGLNSREKLIEPSLNEIAFGEWSGLRLEDIEPRILRERERDKWNWRPPKGESYHDVSVRLGGFIRQLKSLEDEDIAVIGHETCNKVLIGSLLGFSRDEILGLRQPNDCVYKIENRILYRKIFTGETTW